MVDSSWWLTERCKVRWGFWTNASENIVDDLTENSYFYGRNLQINFGTRNLGIYYKYWLLKQWLLKQILIKIGCWALEKCVFDKLSSKKKVFVEDTILWQQYEARWKLFYFCTLLHRYRHTSNTSVEAVKFQVQWNLWNHLQDQQKSVTSSELVF